jgi:FkbM family methyltransferase
MKTKATRSEEFKYDYDLRSLQAITPKKRNFQMFVTQRYLHHYMGNSYEDLTADLVLRYSKEYMLFIDIGAHYGFYTLLIASQFKHSRILAFEPVPENCEILKRNVKLNKLKNVEIFNLAVSNREEIKEFNITEASDSSSFYTHPFVKTLKTKKIKSISLDNLLKNNPKAPTIIKIDTDGHELCVLEGMRNVIKKNQEIKLIIEFNPKMLRSAGFKPEVLLEKLYELGFDVYFVNDQHRETYKLDMTNVNNWGNYVDNESYINIFCTKSKKSLSVCFFSHSAYLAGAERSLLELVIELIRDHGVICTVILPSDGPLRQRLEQVGASTTTMQYDWWCDLNRHTKEGLNRKLNDSFQIVFGQLKEKIEKINPHVILTNTIVIPWGAVVASILNKPHVWFIREHGQNFKFYFPFQDVLKIIRDSSNIILTNSRAVKKTLFLNTSEPNIFIIRQYIDIPQNFIANDKNYYFTRTGATKLLIAGTVTESKGQRDAVLAVRELVNRGRDIELIIVGYSDARYLRELKDVVKYENLDKFIRFIGFQENVYPLINKADIVLMCSSNEAYGRVTIEAMLLRKPVIGTNSGGTPELIRDGFNGLLYEAGNYSQLADRIEYLIENRKKIREFGENGYKFAKGHFNKQEYVGRFYKILMDVKNKKNPSITYYWHFVTKNMLLMLSSIKSSINDKDIRIANLELSLREKDLALNRLYNSTGWKILLNFYQLRNMFLPTNTRRRLIAQIILMTITEPKIVFKKLTRRNLKKFFYYFNSAQPSALERKLKRDTAEFLHADKLGGVGEKSVLHYEEGSVSILHVADRRLESAEKLVEKPEMSLKVDNIRVIAFYLPQFHPIPENDLWWGKGFTDWVNVVKAKPNFLGHYQPHIPTDLGFYDLRVPEVREQQADLARRHGIYGFCYHHYWFHGHRLLERPFNEVLKSGSPDFPFCLCWANENWTRRWDGDEQEILIAQKHSKEDDIAFIRDVIPAFRDERYIRIKGKPLLIVYRVNLLLNPKETAEVWREECKKAGIDIYLCVAQSFDITDPRQYGFDAAVEFPPHGIFIPTINQAVQITNRDFKGLIYSYDEITIFMKGKKCPRYTLFRTVMPSWDNTPRRQNAGNIFQNASPEAYKEWLYYSIGYTGKNLEGDERLVFINAWNEWAEGAHLEPDRKYGSAYLEATADTILAVSATKNCQIT